MGPSALYGRSRAGDWAVVLKDFEGRLLGAESFPIAAAPFEKRLFPAFWNGRLGNVQVVVHPPWIPGFLETQFHDLAGDKATAGWKVPPPADIMTTVCFQVWQFKVARAMRHRYRLPISARGAVD